MRNILLIIGQLGFGGAERQLLYLLQGMDRSQYNPTLCVLEVDEVIPEFQSLRLPIIRFKRHLPRYDISRFFHLLRLIRQVRPQVLHAFLGVANFYAGFAGLLTGIPVIISERNAIPHPLPHRVDRWMAQTMMRRASRVVANSRAGADLVIQHHGLPPEKVTVIHNGLDPAPFDALRNPQKIRLALGLRAETPTIGMIGTIEGFRKDHVTFLRALGLLKLRHSADFQIVCVGGGPKLTEVQNLANELGLRECTRFTGQRADVPEIMAALDILVCCSRYEGLPNVIMEAMAARKPVVATAVGGIPELVVDDVTGFLAPPRNPGAVADKLQTLLENPDLAIRMGEAGRLRVEQEFSLTKMIRGTEAVYQSLPGDGLTSPYHWRG